MFCYQIVSILSTVVATLIGLLRLAIRFLKLSKFFIDDFLLFFAGVTLVAATVMVNLVLPYNQIEVDVGARLIPPPPDIIHILDYDVKYQAAAVVLANATIFGVKFSFIFFFRQLLGHTGRLNVYWWCVFVFTIPCAVICACTEFIVCPAFGERILAVCVHSGLKRQTAALYATVVLDILSDVLLISIPVILLWNVQMNIRRKLGIGWLLCLSSFCIVCAIVRAVGHNLTNGQNDVVWILFWSHMEACVGIIACSMTAYRGLWNIVRSNGAKLGPFGRARDTPTRIDSPSNKRDQIPQLNLSSMTSGLRGMLIWDPFEERANNVTNEDELKTSGNTSLEDTVVDSSNATRRVR